eukprot:Selendium_serpulae@DN5362_c0_g1_i2.p1
MNLGSQKNSRKNSSVIFALKTILKEQKQRSSQNKSSLDTEMGRKVNWVDAETRHAATTLVSASSVSPTPLIFRDTQTSASLMRMFVLFLKDHLFRVLDMTSHDCLPSAECFDVRNPLAGTRACKRMTFGGQTEPWME